jgi:GxxExxY protein
MFLELKQSGCSVRKQYPIKVFYNAVEVGEYFADLLVDENVIVELKAAEILAEEHELQLLNYLRATDAEVGLVLNFGKKPQFRRKLFENKYKKRQV